VLHWKISVFSLQFRPIKIRDVQPFLPCLLALGTAILLAISWAFCRCLATLPCQTNTSCLFALFNCDIDSTQVPKQCSIHFVSQSSSVTPNSSAMSASFSHAFPDSGSLEAVVKTIHVSLVTVNHLVFQHASCASTWVFEFVAELPIRSKTKTNRTVYTQFFPRFVQVTGNCEVFWLCNFADCSRFDWSELLLVLVFWQSFENCSIRQRLVR